MRTTLVFVIGIICATTVPAVAQQPEGRDGWQANGSLVAAARVAAEGRDGWQANGSLVAAARVAAARVAVARVIAGQEEQQYRRQISTGLAVGGGIALALGTYLILPCFSEEGLFSDGDACGDLQIYGGGTLMGAGAGLLWGGLVGRQVPVNPSLQWSVTPGGLRLSW